MKHTRILVTHYGGPDALGVLEEACPEPEPGEVRVKVLTAGVSLPDILAREGVHPETPRVPFTPGWDLVGVVDRLGDRASGVEPGQVVAAMLNGHALVVDGGLIGGRQWSEGLQRRGIIEAAMRKAAG